MSFFSEDMTTTANELTTMIESSIAESTEIMTDTEMVGSTEMVTSIEMIADAETITSTEMIADTETITRPEIIVDTETVTSIEMIADAETITSNEMIADTETITRPEIIVDTETVTSTETTTSTEVVTSTETTTSTEVVTSSETATSTDAVTSTKTATSTDVITSTKTATSTEMMTTSKSIANRSNFLKLVFISLKFLIVACFSPIITLIPSKSSLSSPIQFRRNQDFYISSNIELFCNGSLSTQIKWTVYNCSSSCSYEIQLDQTIMRTTNELNIPARTLSYGVYQLNLTVSMIVSSGLTTTVSAYVRITASGITANLVQLGTSMITSGYQQDLVLNPGSYSVDLDGYIFNASVSH